jgi:hypothetical protein
MTRAEWEARVEARLWEIFLLAPPDWPAAAQHFAERVLDARAQALRELGPAPADEEP